MIADSEEVELNMEDRIMEAFNTEFNHHFPQHVLSPAFSGMIKDYIHLASGIAVTNTIEQIIAFLKVAQHCEDQLPITMIIEYLKKTEFQYKQTKTQSNGRFKIQNNAEHRNGETAIITKP
jgi:hypothetical protein